MAHLTSVAISALLTSALAAQIPAHASLLNPSQPQDQMRFRHQGETIHCVGVTRGTQPYVVNYARSQDGGRTFPLVDVPLAYIGGNSSLVSGLLGNLTVDGAFVGTVVGMPWVGPHLLRSLDGGNTWQPPTRLSLEYSLHVARRPFVHASGNDVCIVWNEPRATGHVWSQHSADLGNTWRTSDLALDGSLPFANDWSLLSAGDGRHLHVVHNRATTPLAVYHHRSLDGGRTWTTTPQPIGTTTIAHLTVSGSLVVAAGDTGAAMLVSPDAGSTWSNRSVPGIAATEQIRSLAVHGQRILVVALQAPALPTNVLLQVSADAGATWLPQPYVVGLYRDGYMIAHAGPDALFVQFPFSDQRHPPGALIQSDDDGVNWRLVTGEIGREFVALDAGGLALTHSGVGSTDWQAWVVGGHTTHGAGTAGAGGFVPKLRGRGTVGIGRTIGFEVEGTRGGAPTMFFWSTGPLTNQAVGSSTLYLPQVLAGRLVAANGAAGLPGVGVASTAMVIPNDPALAGLRLATQAFALDASVPDGFVASGAVESWVY
jgi:hypothetical protein